MLVDKSEFEVKSTLDGRKIAMTFDENSLAHIMSILTDLYSDPEMAIIREYSTNALDSHIEAGETRPIEVTLPSALSPFLKIKDYGIGLSVDDINAIYSKYGASTKRESNEQVGVLGLGCKSALTYTAQFSLVAVKDNVRTQVSVSRDEDGAGSMTIVDTSYTEDANGVEVIIPTKRANGFEFKAEKFFQYWNPGTVLVNGKRPERFKGTRIADNLYIVRSADPFVVMGGVAYPVDFTHFDRASLNLSYKHSIVAFVDIGAVNFVPSREALHYTPKTKKALDSIKAEFKVKSKQYIDAKVEEASTKYEALEFASELSSIFSNTSLLQLSYKGILFPGKWFETKENTDKVVSGYGSTLSSRVAVPQWNSALWFYGFELSNLTARHRDKIDEWKRLQNNDAISKKNTYICLKDRPDVEEWINPAYIIDWNDISSIKLKRAVSTASQSAQKVDYYDVLNGGFYPKKTSSKDIDTTKPIYYYTDGWQNAGKYVRYLSDGTFLSVPKNRVAKFLRLFPNAVEARQAVKDSYENWLKGLIAEDRKLFEICDVDLSRYSTLEADKIDDPDFKEMVNLSRNPKLRTLREKRSAWRAIDIVIPYGELKYNVADKYPLIIYSRYIDSTFKEHTYIYINAVYAAQREKEKEENAIYAN